MPPSFPPLCLRAAPPPDLPPAPTPPRTTVPDRVRAVWGRFAPSTTVLLLPARCALCCITPFRCLVFPVSWLAEGRGRAQHLCAGSPHLYPLLRYLYCPFCLPLGFPYVTEGRGGVQHLCAGAPHLYPLLRYCCYQLCRYSGTSPAIAVCASLSPPPVPCSRARHHPWCVAFLVSFVVRDYLLLVLAVVLPVP